MIFKKTVVLSYFLSKIGNKSVSTVCQYLAQLVDIKRKYRTTYSFLEMKKVFKQKCRKFHSVPKTAFRG
ncbi:hypothetical protein LFU01_37540 [Lysinibacillus fusiformis]|nr:hypothetical protein LFU01_37540 [Lysinibacillus fusiformis]